MIIYFLRRLSECDNVIRGCINASNNKTVAVLAFSNESCELFKFSSGNTNIQVKLSLSGRLLRLFGLI